MNAKTNLSKKLVLSSALAGMAFSAPFATNTYAATVSYPKKLKIDSTQVLRFGSQGKAVQTLQTALDDEDFYHGPLDGIYGLHTRHAVTRYQQVVGLRVDGKAGPKTLSSLFTVQGQYKPSEKLLSTGDRGHAVRAAQSQLKSLGYYGYQVDGIFGGITRDAVRYFQAANDLKIDGIIGPNTRDALFGPNPKSAQTLTTQTLSVSTSHSESKSSQSSNSSKSTNSSSSSESFESSADPHHSNFSNLLAFAKQFIGVPYQWGGTSPSGFDCSGFVNYVYQHHGVNLPRTTSGIWNYGVPVDHAQAGDLLFFETYKAGPSHVGIYLGGGRFVHADSDRGITISNLNLDYWDSHYIGAERIVQN